MAKIKRTRVFGIPLDDSTHAGVFFRGELENVQQVFSYSWEKNSALFLSFAELTDDRIESFRQENAIENSDVIVVDVTNDRVIETVGSQIRYGRDGWKSEVGAMKRCLALWHLVRDDDQEKLSRVVRWDRSPKNGLEVKYESQSGEEPGRKVTEVIASESDTPELLRRFSAGDIVGPAWFYLERSINDRLRNHIHARMVARIPGRPNTKTMSLHPVPENFFVAVWLQFAQAIDEDKRFRQCVVCKSWFEVSRGKAHKARLYCSEYCKVSAYRKRKEHGWKLHVDGKTVGEIAKLLDTDKKTVKGWIDAIRKEK